MPPRQAARLVHRKRGAACGRSWAGTERQFRMPLDGKPRWCWSRLSGSIEVAISDDAVREVYVAGQNSQPGSGVTSKLFTILDAFADRESMSAAEVAHGTALPPWCSENVAGGGTTFCNSLT